MHDSALKHVSNKGNLYQVKCKKDENNREVNVFSENRFLMQRHSCPGTDGNTGMYLPFLWIANEAALIPYEWCGEGASIRLQQEGEVIRETEWESRKQMCVLYPWNLPTLVLTARLSPISG